MQYTVTTASPLPISLCENDEVNSVLQNVAILCSTQKGSIPMYREYGLPQRYLGKPQAIAETIVAQEVITALAEFEPRATLISASVSTNNQNKTIIEVVIEI